MPSNSPKNIVALADRVALLCGMNNGGVDHFVKGRYQVACSIFADALKASESLVTCREALATDNVEAPAIESYLHMFQTTPIPKAKYHASRYRSEGTLASLEGTFVYQRAILLQYADGSTDVTSIVNIVTVVLYNMAIALHMHGTMTFSLPTLQQASYFYSLSLSSQASTGGGQNIAPLPLVYYGAILNNLGEIHFHLGQYDHLKAVYNHLGELLPRVVQARVLTPSEQIGLLCNTTGLKKPSLAAAA